MMPLADGEEPNVLRAAIAFKEGGYGTPVLVGREDVYDQLKEIGVENPHDYEVLNSRNSPLVGRAVDHIYAKHQRHGYLRREVERLVNQDRNYFAAAMLALGEADAMITGTTRPFSQSLRQVRTVINAEPGATTFGNPPGVHIEGLRDAVALLDSFHPDFEYEGEMAPDVALNFDMQQRYYPFSRLSSPANLLVMPGLQSAS